MTPPAPGRRRGLKVQVTSVARFAGPASPVYEASRTWGPFAPWLAMGMAGVGPWLF